MKIWPGYVNDVMHRKRARRILGFWEKWVSWVLASDEDGWLSGSRRHQTSSWRWGAARGGVGGQMEKSGWKDCISLSLCRITFNSEVIKSFVPELRSRKCFLCFGIPMLFICALWTFYVYFTYPYHGYLIQLPWYHQPFKVTTMAWTAAVTWCKRRKIAHATKILQTFWLT